MTSLRSSKREYEQGVAACSEIPGRGGGGAARMTASPQLTQGITRHSLIVGGGVSGIASACRFQMDLGLTNFLIFEKSEALGGTWYNNRYPGVGCDIPTRLYSLSECSVYVRALIRRS